MGPVARESAVGQTDSLAPSGFVPLVDNRRQPERLLATAAMSVNPLMPFLAAAFMDDDLRATCPMSVSTLITTACLAFRIYGVPF